MKITQEQQEKGQELYNQLVIKAWESATFKEQLIENPETTIAEVTGQTDFNNNTKIVVEDQTDTDIIYLNIPRKVNLNDFELTDEQLERVSGGEDRNFGQNVGYYLMAFIDYVGQNSIPQGPRYM